MTPAYGKKGLRAPPHRSMVTRRRGRVAATAPRFPTIWWTDPTYCLLALILPVYLISSALGGPMMPDFGSMNFLTPGTILIGCSCIVGLAVGSQIGKTVKTKPGLGIADVNWAAFDRAYLVLMVVCLIAHLVMVGGILAHPGNLISTLRGDKGAIYDTKDQVNKLVGLTSFTNIAPLIMAMSGIRKSIKGRAARHSILFYALIGLMLIRAFGAAQRFSLIESAVGFVLPYFLLKQKNSNTIRFFPITGFILLFILFAAGEYTRSWEYYAGKYNSFFEFVVLRLLAYISVASNTAAGIYTEFGSVGHPFLTATWLERIRTNSDTNYSSVLDRYFASYGNAEFNNPSGIMAGVIDYGVIAGVIYCILSGLIAGVFFNKFKCGELLGLMCFPMFFIGIIVMTQTLYWSDPRFLVLFPSGIFAVLYVSSRSRRAKAL